MTAEELFGKVSGPFVTLVVGALGGGGLWKWLSARETAQPDLVEQSSAMMDVAFDRMDAELKRQDEREKQMVRDLDSLRADRHRLRNALMVCKSYVDKVEAYARMLQAALAALGQPYPEVPKAPDIDELMNGPVATYQFDAAGRPKTDKDAPR